MDVTNSATAILAIDLGTSSARARFYDAQTTLPISGATAASPHEPDVTTDGGATLDPEALVAEIVACCRAALDKLPQDVSVVGVGMSCFWHSILGVDSAGKPITPVLLWSDRRSAATVARLKQAQPTLPEQTGCPWHTSYVLGRLAWLAETQPALDQRCTQFLSPAAYLYGRLFGQEAAYESVAMASASGLYDQTVQRWLPNHISRLAPISDEPARGLVPEFATILPELADIPWFPALGDGACSNLGCGATTPERIALMIGTSAALRAVATRGSACPTLPSGLWRYQVGPEWFVLGGALTNGGAVWAYLKETLKLPPVNDDALEAQLAALVPDSHGLTVLPFLSGERAPLWRDDLSAVLVGMCAATTPLQLVRAHLEAIAYRLAAVRDRLKTVAPDATLIGTGAALRASPVWCQIIADVLGEPILLADEDEASARGAALWAREGLGMGRIEDAPAPTILRSFVPNPEHTLVYAAARARHEALLQQIFP